MLLTSRDNEDDDDHGDEWQQQHWRSTLVSMGPGAMALNLIPYFPHSAASDLHKKTLTELLKSVVCNRTFKLHNKGVARGGPGVPVTPPFASLF